VDRRDFLKLLSAAGIATGVSPADFAFAAGTAALPSSPYHPGRIPNEFSLYLPGEKQALATAPEVSGFSSGGVLAKLGSMKRQLSLGENIEGWTLVSIGDINGVATAVFEKHCTHRGAIAYVTERGGTIALIPKYIGDLAKIHPRPTNTPHGVKLEREKNFVPGPDVPGEYILRSEEDPCYENVAALGAEYIGWSLVANEQAGPLRSVYLEANGRTRQPAPNPQSTWAPDLEGSLFDPERFLPFADPQNYKYEHGYSKRTLLGGYLPVADTGVWNEQYGAGYEVMMLLPPGAEARPIARVRILIPAGQVAHYDGKSPLVHDPDGRTYAEYYWNTSRESFFAALVGVWNHWHSFYEDSMPVEVPDEWLLNAARAGITLSRCSYRGLEPTYQIGEGAYTKIPERSHALFPVAHYEFIWAHQLWNLTGASDPYFQHYLDHYTLPDGNFIYNTQDQVEAPLNTGIFLMNSARAYFYTRDLKSFEQRLAVLERMLAFVLERYEYGKQHYPKPDRRYGLIWGSPEADLGDPDNDYPNAHPFYFQNATCTWRGLVEHAKALKQAGSSAGNVQYTTLGNRYAALAEEMRANIQSSIEATIAASNEDMRNSGITPFEPNDTARRPAQLSSYENHRFMMDWFLADWGVPALDLGHLKHREIAGEQICGLHTDGDAQRTSNFMEHGTLAVRIRQADYRPFLLTLYSLVCYAADSGNRYSPEDAYIPGSYPGEQSPYGWSAVVNSTLQPTLGLRWLLCYEESDRDICHLQKAAPKHWFARGERISVKQCPTRFGQINWTTEAIGDHQWRVVVDVTDGFSGDVLLHIYPADKTSISRTSAGTVEGTAVMLPKSLFSGNRHLEVDIS
jgi:hypothetical protein